MSNQVEVVVSGSAQVVVQPAGPSSPGIQVIAPATAVVAEVSVPGPQGPIGPTAVAPLRRHDFAAPYDYCATAPAGSAESATVWTITRINVASNGTTTTATATGVSWTGRTSATYS